MNELDKYQYQQLTGQAECYIHTHPRDINYTFPHGGFSDNTTQTASINTATPMEFNTTDVNDGVEVLGTPPTQITAPQTGTYNLQFSAQLVNVDVPSVNISVWLSINGNNVANSCTFVTVPGKHAGGDGYVVASWNFFAQLEKGEYAEIYWSTPSIAVSIPYIPEQVSPTRPATPSIILTVSYVSD